MLLDFPMPEDVRLAIMLAAFMGLRRSEIFALNVRDFNFDKKLLYVNKAMVKSPSGEYVIKTTKTYSGTRSLPIPERMLQELQSYNMTDPLMKRSPNAFTAFFEKTLKKMSIRSFRFHDLRHYYASVLLSLNVPDKYAMDLMGHSSTNMLKTVYQHIMPDKKQEIS